MRVTNADKSVKVSIVMPVYNEEKYIGKCIESLLCQTYPKDDMEWIFIDGYSKDRTVELLEEYRDKYPELIRIFMNEHKIVPYAMNIGIKESKGIYVIRLDAHADYAKDYIEKCVLYLEKTDADNVGGVAETKSNGFVGNCIAKMLSTKFGVGNSQFRTNGESGYVDTVPFGAFRREVFQKYGGYDERLVRNQDNEMNYRIRKNGGKIYLANDIRLSYYCRDTVKGISKMAYQNGTWNIITMKLCPGAMGVRHFVPLMFVMSIACLLGMSFFLFFARVLLAIELLLYGGLDLYFSMNAGKSMKEVFCLILLYPIFHITYGFGSLKGLLLLFQKKYRNQNYIPKKI